MYPRPRLPVLSALFGERLRRVVAWGSCALVLTLGLLAVSPEVHAWLHAGPQEGQCCGHSHDADRGPHATDDAGCIVELFAQGLEGGAAVVALAAMPARRAGEAAVAPPAPAVRPPRYLHQPERGPPGGLRASAV